MGNDTSCVALALKVWKTQLDRADKLFGALSSEEVLREIATGRNRVLYLWGHLTAAHDASRTRSDRPITLGAKWPGTPSAGNRHARCDVAGTGNGLTVRLVRHSQRKRGATDRPDLRGTAPVLDPTFPQAPHPSSLSLKEEKTTKKDQLSATVH
jgi:hypothetical protein